MNIINLHEIHVSDIELFLKVAEYKSFTKAGEKLYMSQSWVSKRISIMEHELGISLFFRNKREVMLTPAGRVLVDRFQQISDYILDALHDAHAAQSGMLGVVKVGYLEWGDIVFIDPLEQFISENSQIAVEIYRRQFSDLRTEVSGGRLDVIFTVSYDCNQFSKSDFFIMKTRRIPMMAYMSPNHLLAKKSSIKVEELRAEPMLMVDPISSSGYVSHVNSIFEKHHIRPLVAQYATDGGAHMGNILINKGILIASQLFLEKSWSDKIARVPIEGEDIYVNAVWQKNNRNPAFKKYLKYVIDMRPELDENQDDMREILAYVNS